MGIWVAILRFFGLVEPAEEEVIDYPAPEPKPPPEPEPQVLDYRKDALKPRPVRIAVVRPELNRHGRVTFSLSVYTENLREGYILLVDVGKIVNQNREEARRIINFLSGVVQAINGKRREIGPNLYLFAPPSVQIKGDILRDEES